MIDMSKFVGYDWTLLYYINLSEAQVDDQKWKIFSSKGHLFSSLRSVELSRNKITRV